MIIIIKAKKVENKFKLVNQIKLNKTMLNQTAIMMMRIKELHAQKAVTFGGFEYPRHVTVPVEKVALKKNEIGILFGKHSQAAESVLFFPGVVHAGWSGQLRVESVAMGQKFTIKKGDEVAHLLIFSQDENIKYEK